MEFFPALKKASRGISYSAVALLVLSFIQCASKHSITSSAAADAGSDKGLKDYYKNYFPIGAAISMASLHGPDSALIVKEFYSVTPENDMKMGPIHPSENVYNWKNADQIVDFAMSHHIRIRGHNLCWHNQEAAWM